MANAVEIRGADRINALLKALPREVTASKNGGICAKAMRKGANVILKEAKPALQRSIDVNGDESSGLLMKNLKARRKKAKFKGEHFSVGVGNKRYPTNKTWTDKNGKERPVNRKGASTRLNGQRLEYGTSHQPETPWVRPTFAKTHLLAFTTINTELLSSLDKLAKIHLPQER